MYKLKPLVVPVNYSLYLGSCSVAQGYVLKQV
jgi:hypothetical protein